MGVATADELLLNPKYWHDRAEEARTMASQMRDKTAQVALEQVAQGYDRLAAIAERAKAKARPKGE
jgi:hypothetical protein